MVESRGKALGREKEGRGGEGMGKYSGGWTQEAFWEVDVAGNRSRFEDEVKLRIWSLRPSVHQ